MPAGGKSEGKIIPFVRPDADGRPLHRPRFAQPRRSLVESWAPANRYERELVDLLIAPSLRHYAGVLLGHAQPDRAQPTNKHEWPPDVRDWLVLWPALLQDTGTHQALAVAWWLRLESSERQALREYLNLGASEYDPEICADLAMWEMLAWEREKHLASAASAPKPVAVAQPEGPRADQEPAGYPRTRDVPVAVGLW